MSSLYLNGAADLETGVEVAGVAHVDHAGSGGVAGAAPAQLQLRPPAEADRRLGATAGSWGSAA